MSCMSALLPLACLQNLKGYACTSFNSQCRPSVGLLYITALLFCQDCEALEQFLARAEPGWSRDSLPVWHRKLPYLQVS